MVKVEKNKTFGWIVGILVVCAAIAVPFGIIFGSKNEKIDYVRISEPKIVLAEKEIIKKVKIEDVESIRRRIIKSTVRKSIININESEDATPSSLSFEYESSYCTNYDNPDTIFSGIQLISVKLIDPITKDKSICQPKTTYSNTPLISDLYIGLSEIAINRGWSLSLFDTLTPTEKNESLGIVQKNTKVLVVEKPIESNFTIKTTTNERLYAFALPQAVDLDNPYSWFEQSPPSEKGYTYLGDSRISINLKPTTELLSALTNDNIIWINDKKFDYSNEYNLDVDLALKIHAFQNSQSASQNWDLKTWSTKLDEMEQAGSNTLLKWNIVKWTNILLGLRLESSNWFIIGAYKNYLNIDNNYNILVEILKSNFSKPTHVAFNELITKLPDFKTAIVATNDIAKLFDKNFGNEMSLGNAPDYPTL